MSCKHVRNLALAAVLAFSASAALAMGSSPGPDEEAVNVRIQPVARIALAASAPKTAAGSRSGEDMVKAVCGACHTAGVAGAPKIGDKGAWAPRIALGLDGLLKSAIAGKNAMPPKGGAADATEDEIKRAIIVMADQSGASFK
jgi:cytochrome c5